MGDHTTVTSSSRLSDKPIPVEERLIVALDVPSYDDAIALVDHLGDSCHFYKVGLELFMTGRYFDLVEELRRRQKKVFVDLKFFDVPETVASAVRQLEGREASFITVHGNRNMLEAACRERSGARILAVTVLTSLDEDDLEEMGFQVEPKELVLARARQALDVGCDGVISSGLEAADLRDEFGDKFLVVTPGIRPVANVDDQKRTVDVEEAFLSGADHIVMGRPIRENPDGLSPHQAAEAVQSRIRKVFGQDGAHGDRPRAPGGAG